MKFGISLTDFVFLNPAINENCTNLYAEESYCVQAVGDINTYSGRPGHVTFSLTMTSGFEDSATTLPDVSWSSPTPTTTQIPIATGTREDCYQYLVGDNYQKDMTGTSLLSNCRLAAAVYEVTLEDLEVWNPSLGNVSDTACAFQKGFRYCGQWYDALKPSEPDEEIDPMDSAYPGRDGMIETCTEIVDVDEDGYPSCQDILSDYELTIAEFYAWNPSVGADCSGMWADIEDPTPTTTIVSSITAPTASSKPTPPGPTHAGQPDNCNKWHVVKSGDDCSTIESQYALTHAEFLAFNPAVSEDCLSNFWGDYAYCVGTDSSGGSEPVTTTLSSAAASTPTNGPVAAPEPNQAGNAVTSCNKYAQAQSGDWCAAFVERHSLAAADFYSWNTVLGSTGENCGGSFWAEYWYCIGVAP
ncbi:hypothetical protein N0V92_005734 [Colletotrichum tropicale]|nr:hypothetical protein N0V92_005734 [Colletotrichum tropicale]